MKNQKGFTLVELMVVMAIIAILATAGITQYSGFIKTARDTTRITDLKAVEVFIISVMTKDGQVPEEATFNDDLKIFAGKTFNDPSNGAKSCIKTMTGSTITTDSCKYEYGICDEGGGYVIRARLEDKEKFALYADDEYAGTASTENAEFYEIGNCAGIYPASFITIEGGGGTSTGATSAGT
jgi:prepilin-type N-terminal cleavage/methylation domain-containing protein